jgi:hypothetical protein
MQKFKLVQTRYNGTLTKILEVNTVDTFASMATALDYLAKRGYTFDTVRNAYIQGNAIQAQVSIQEPVARSIFDIRSFV